jgi:predicted cobalt transporter CbtA
MLLPVLRKPALSLFNQGSRPGCKPWASAGLLVAMGLTSALPINPAAGLPKEASLGEAMVSDTATGLGVFFLKKLNI